VLGGNMGALFIEVAGGRPKGYRIALLTS